MADAEIADVLGDARWLAHRYDRQRDEVIFIWLPRKAHRAAAFLTNSELAGDVPRRAIPRRALATYRTSSAPLHLILHSGLTGSTLLTHALDREGVAMTLSEPPILTDVVGYHLAGGSARQTGALLDDVISLLARPFSAGESVIIKMGSIGNALGGEILARHPTSKALCLHAPLPTYLASIARKGLQGRIWGRKLLATLRSANLADLGFDDADLLEHTDLQIAADAWLALHRIMGQASVRCGDRLRVTDSQCLTSRLEAVLTAIADHFTLNLDVAEIVHDPVLSRHSKTGAPFDADQQAAELSAAAIAHREEIDLVVDWARKVAEVNNIAWTLPRPLLG